MNYLEKYGKQPRKFQEGGPVPAPQGGAPEGGGGPSGEDVLALAQATVSGDQAAAAQLGTLVAPMILEQAGGAGGGAPQAAPEAVPAPAEGEPVFKKGGQFLKRA